MQVKIFSGNGSFDSEIAINNWLEKMPSHIEIKFIKQTSFIDTDGSPILTISIWYI